MQDKHYLSIDSVKPGMSTAEVVFNKFGSVVLWDGIVLDEGMISRLKAMGVQNITVFLNNTQPGQDTRASMVVNHDQEFTLEYEKDASEIKYVFQELATGRKLNVEATEQVLNSVIDKSVENRNVINSIMQVRSIDEYTYYHSLNVSMLCMLIGKWLKLDEENVRKLTQAGLLHDIGKTRIPLNILNKPGKLTDSELAEMRKHSEYGYALVADIREIPPEVAVAVLTHHEKEDGSGYPLGLTGERLNLFSKIITVADIFDAMTANRSYKSKDTPFKVFDLMQHGSFGVLDPLVLNTFLENITHYYVGAKVKLNTGDIAEVVFMNKLDFSKPVVQVGDRYMDLSVSKIVRVVEFV